MEAFLKDSKLDHLCDALSSTLSIDESLSLLEEGRPKLLARLKELGVRKPPDLSAFAKAVANGRRDLIGSGLPVVVCLYSAGMTIAGGRSLMKPMMDALASAGFKDQLTLDHHNEAPYDACKTFDEYSKALHEALNAEPKFKGRPFVLVAHSHGSNGAYGLARLLGPKARILITIGRRPPTVELIGDVFGEPTCAGIAALPAQQFATMLGDAYTNAALVEAVTDKEESDWLPGFRESVAVAKAQYSSPCCLCDISDMVAYFGEGVRSDPPVVDLGCVLRTPILGIAASAEEAKGETPEKMRKWAALTSAGFSLQEMEKCLHMELPRDARVIKAVVDAIKPFAPADGRDVPAVS